MIQELFDGILPKIKELLISKLKVEQPEPENLSFEFQTPNSGKVYFDFADARHEVMLEIEDDEVSLNDEIKTLTPNEEPEKTGEVRDEKSDLIMKEISEIKAKMAELEKGMYKQPRNEEKSKTNLENNKSVKTFKVDGVDMTLEEIKKSYL